MDRVIDFLKNLEKPTCKIKTENIAFGSKLTKDKSVVEFLCQYSEKKDNKYQEYKKRIVYKGKRK